MSDTWATRSISTQHYHPKSALTSECTKFHQTGGKDELPETSSLLPASTQCHNVKTSVISHDTDTHYNSCSTDQFVAMKKEQTNKMHKLILD